MKASKTTQRDTVMPSHNYEYIYQNALHTIIMLASICLFGCNKANNISHYDAHYRTSDISNRAVTEEVVCNNAATEYQSLDAGSRVAVCNLEGLSVHELLENSKALSLQLPLVLSSGYNSVILTAESPMDERRLIRLFYTFRGNYAYIEYKERRGWVRSGDPLPGCNDRTNYYPHVESVDHRNTTVVVNIPFYMHYSGREAQIHIEESERALGK